MAIYIAKEIKCSTCAKTDSPTSTTVAKGGSSQVQGSYDWIYRTFLQYDLSGLPENATIVSANMYIYCTFHNDYATNSTTNIARVTSEWSDDTCCWNNQPTWTGTYMSASVRPPAVNEWGKWDITELVKGWFNGDYPNYGLYIVNNGEGGYRYNWGFRNHYYDIKNSDDGDDTNNFGTYITIEYTVPYYKISNSALTDIADGIRAIVGTQEKLTPAQMAQVLADSKIAISESKKFGIRHGSPTYTLFPVLPPVIINASKENRILSNNLYHGNVSIITVEE